MFDYKLISGNPIEMNMTQLVHNQFFVKDKSAWYRDFEREISCRDLIREIVKKNSKIIEVNPCFFENDDYLDEELFYWTQYGTDNIYGILGMYYTAMWGMADVREWYKDALCVKATE